jgi:hypothetical protein
MEIMDGIDMLVFGPEIGSRFWQDDQSAEMTMPVELDMRKCRWQYSIATQV